MPISGSGRGAGFSIQVFCYPRQEQYLYGTIEVSQYVTEIRQLKGEQRLLDWNN